MSRAELRQRGTVQTYSPSTAWGLTLPYPLDKSRTALLCSNKACAGGWQRSLFILFQKQKEKENHEPLETVQGCGLLRICLACTKEAALPWPYVQSTLTAVLWLGKLIYIDFLGSMIHTDWTTKIKKLENWEISLIWSPLCISCFSAGLHPSFNKYLLSFLYAKSYAGLDVRTLVRHNLPIRSLESSRGYRHPYQQSQYNESTVVRDRLLNFREKTPNPFLQR